MLSRRATAAVNQALVAIAFFCAQAAAAADIATVEGLVFEKVNEFRRAQGRDALATDPRLEATARDFAQYMARTDRYGHEADGRTPAQRATAHDYDYCLVAENLAYQFSSAGFGNEELARRLVEGWKDSPGHRRNMLERDATGTGVALAKSERTGRYYAVQMFGRPNSEGVRFRVRNETGKPARYRIREETFTLAPREAHTHRRCAPEPIAAGSGPPLETRDGDRLSVVQSGDGVALRRDSRPESER